MFRCLLVNRTIACITTHIIPQVCLARLAKLALHSITPDLHARRKAYLFAVTESKYMSGKV